MGVLDKFLNVMKLNDNGFDDDEFWMMKSMIMKNRPKKQFSKTG